MWYRIVPLAAVLAFIGTARAADKPMLLVQEQAIEAASTGIRLPQRTPGTLFARSCETCPEKTLRVANATRFFLGTDQVMQPEFNAAVQRSAPLLGIFYDGKTSEVTRLVAFGLSGKVSVGTSSKNSRGQ